MRGKIEIVFWEIQAAFPTSDWHSHHIRTQPVWSERDGTQTSLGFPLYCWAVSMNIKYLFISTVSCAFGHWFLSCGSKQKSIISFLNHSLWNILKFYRFLPPDLRFLVYYFVYYLTDPRWSKFLARSRMSTDTCWMNDSFFRSRRVKIKSYFYAYCVSICKC